MYEKYVGYDLPRFIVDADGSTSNFIQDFMNGFFLLDKIQKSLSLRRNYYVKLRPIMDFEDDKMPMVLTMQTHSIILVKNNLIWHSSVSLGDQVIMVFSVD